MGWLLCPTAAAFILKNLLPCLGNDTECRMKAYGSRAVNAGKALERKLKGPGSQSGDGEERRKGMVEWGSMGWLSWGRKGGRLQGEQLPSPSTRDLCIYLIIMAI